MKVGHSFCRAHSADSYFFSVKVTTAGTGTEHVVLNPNRGVRHFCAYKIPFDTSFRIIWLNPCSPQSVGQMRQMNCQINLHMLSRTYITVYR